MKRPDPFSRDAMDAAIGESLRGLMYRVAPPMWARARLLRRAARLKRASELENELVAERIRAWDSSTLDHQAHSFRLTIAALRYRYMVGFAKLGLSW